MEQPNPAQSAATAGLALRLAQAAELCDCALRKLAAEKGLDAAATMYGATLFACRILIGNRSSAETVKSFARDVFRSAQSETLKGVPQIDRPPQEIATLSRAADAICRVIEEVRTETGLGEPALFQAAAAAVVQRALQFWSPEDAARFFGVLIEDASERSAHAAE